MAADGFVCKNIWQSAALVYAGFDVSRIEILTHEDIEFHFDGPASLDAQGIVDDYDAGRLVLSDAKSYSLAFTKLNSRIRDMRKRAETSWQALENHAPEKHKEAYWAEARKNIEARRQERERREKRERRK